MIKKLGALLFLLCLLPVTYASAEIKIDATYGLNGKVKMDEPVRVDVVITNNDGAFDGHLLTNYNDSYQLQSARVYPVQLAAGEQIELSFYIENYYGYTDQMTDAFRLYAGDMEDDQLIGNVKITENKPVVINHDALVVGTYHLDAANTSLQQLRALTNREIIVEKLTTPQSNERDYAMFDVLMVGDEINSLSTEQQGALKAWVEQGGKLVTDAALTGTVFEQVAPLLLTDGTVTISTTQLQQLIKGGTFTEALLVKNAALQQEAQAWPTGEMKMAGVRQLQGGELIQTAFTLADVGLLQADGYSHLFGQMIQVNDYRWNSVSDSKHYNIANQLTPNNELFEVFAFSIWKVITVLAIYIVIVSVILYMILKKKDKREHAWWLIPAISVIFSIGLFIVGAKDRLWKPQLQEMMVWTVTDTESTQYFTQSVLANKAGDYTFELQDDVTVATYHMSGVPTATNQPSYQNGQELVLKGVPYWGVKSIVGSAPAPEGLLEQQLVIEEKLLTGTVTNHFPFDLENVQAWIGREFYEIGKVAAGETLEVSIPLKYNYLVSSMLDETLVYPHSNKDLPELRRNSLLQLATTAIGGEASLIIASAPEATVPSTLQKGAKNEKDVLIATPIKATMNYEGELTLASDNLQLEIVHDASYSEWITAGTTEWYFEKVPYTLKYHLPKTLATTVIDWQALTVNNLDNRLQLKVLNHEKGEYEEIEVQQAATYVKDGYVQFELQFVGSEMGDTAPLPTIELKGEVQ